MGNCFALVVGDGGGGGGGGGKGSGRVEEMIKVVTSTGGVMELYAPITAGWVTNEFPGYRLFCGSRRLLPTENLHVGRLYHLLPLSSKDGPPAVAVTTATPYRMSVDHNGSHGSSGSGSSSSGSGYYYNRNSEARGRGKGWGALKGQGYNSDGGGGERSLSDTDVRPRYNGSGVWKVRLVINPEHLSEILSQEARTEELIESVRTVAKCGGGGGGGGGSGSDSGSSRKSTGRSGAGGGGWSSWKGAGVML